ncbi:MAG: WYL domain-containing protein, partial [Paludibacteraceae bacterium]|nr:WYL domain-containing protein [Paludibacteraceae bacterium]
MANTEKKPSLVSKYVWIISTIYHHRRLTFNELNELWVEYTDLSMGEDLPKRTFDNWRAVIADMFGIDIENEQDIAGDGLKSWIYNTQCLSNTIASNLNLKDRILLEDVPSGQQYLQPIIDAMKNGRVITITYRSYWKTEEHTFDLDPYCVKLFKQRWYVVARNRHPKYSGFERIYALDRILQLSVKEERFEFPKNWSGEEFFADCFGIFPGEDTPVETVKLKVTDREANYL